MSEAIYGRNRCGHMDDEAFISLMRVINPTIAIDEIGSSRERQMREQERVTNRRFLSQGKG